MRLSDFILLHEEKKKWILLHEAVLVGKRDSQDFKVFLFQFGAFYVEMFCNYKTKVVEEYRAFGNTPLLHPYLSSIPLDDVMP